MKARAPANVNHESILSPINGLFVSDGHTTVNSAQVMQLNK
jgi:hypothetical protein